MTVWVVRWAEVPLLRDEAHHVRAARGKNRCDAMQQQPTRVHILRWESQDLVIPMAISVRHWRTPDYVSAAAPLVQPTITAALMRVARDGWQPDEPSDFPTLFSCSRVRTTNTLLRWRVTSVTIRVIRPIRWERLVPHG